MKACSDVLLAYAMDHTFVIYVHTGAVYICTEDVFPNKRLQQMTESFSQDQAHEFTAKYLCDNIYVEHVATIVSILSLIPD